MRLIIKALLSLSKLLNLFICLTLLHLCFLFEKILNEFILIYLFLVCNSFLVSVLHSPLSLDDMVLYFSFLLPAILINRKG